MRAPGQSDSVSEPFVSRNQDQRQRATSPTASQEGWTMIAAEHFTDADAAHPATDSDQAAVPQRLLQENTEQGHHNDDGAPESAEQKTPVSSPELQKTSSQLYQTYQELAVLQDRILLTRVQANNEKQKLAACHGFLAESQYDVVSTVDSLLSEDSTPPARDRLRSIKGQLRSDNTAFSSQLEVTKSMDSKLGSLEFALANSQAAFFHEFENLLSVLSPSLANALRSKRDNMQLEPLQATDESTPIIPRLLECYFNQVGEITILEDRLTDAEEDLRDGLRDRENRLDRDEELSTSNEEFHALHRFRREALQEKLDAVQDEVDRLRMECTAAGLDLDPARYRSLASDESHLPVAQWLTQISAEEGQSEPTVDCSPGPEFEDQTAIAARSADSPWAKTAWDMWMNSAVLQGLSQPAV